MFTLTMDYYLFQCLNRLLRSLDSNQWNWRLHFHVHQMFSFDNSLCCVKRTRIPLFLYILDQLFETPGSFRNCQRMCSKHATGCMLHNHHSYTVQLQDPTVVSQIRLVRRHIAMTASILGAYIVMLVIMLVVMFFLVIV